MKRFVRSQLSRISSRRAVPNSEEVRDTILAQGMTVREASAYFYSSATKAVQDSTKGVLTAYGSRRIATCGFKAAKDFGQNNRVCGTLSAISACCETTSILFIWVSFPGKICTVSGLKAISIGCERVRDLCVAEPNNPMC